MALSVAAHVKVKAILVYAYLLLTNAYLIIAVIGIASCRIFRISLVTTWINASLVTSRGLVATFIVLSLA